MSHKIPATWVKQKIGKLVSFRTGKLNSNAAIEKGKYPFFTCSQETYRTNTYSFDTECILLAGNNANGIYPLKFFAGKFDAYQRTYIIETLDKELLNIRFLYYALKLELEHLRLISTGAATKFLTLPILNNIEILLPPISIQDRISNILSEYDELIEYNSRRIQILEETVQTIYREWFTNFRFPGYENISMVESEQGLIPAGWKINNLGDECLIIMGQSPKSEFYNSKGEGLPFHQGVTNFGLRFPKDEIFCSIKNRIAVAGDILFSVRAPVGRINIARNKMVLGRGLCAIRDVNGNQSFFFQQLKEIFRTEDIIGGGTIFKSVTKDDMANIKIIVPSNQTMTDFSKIINPIFSLLEKLFDINDNLEKQRDLLLPKLLNGEFIFE